VVELLLAFALIGQSHTDDCWTSIAPRPQYSASDQVRDLQGRIKTTRCDVVGLAWTTAGGTAQQLAIVWESKLQTLWRLTVDKQGPRWEKWSGATRERILADNPADGFTLGPYIQGKGRSAISLPAGGFVKQHAPGTFDAALPENCSAPVPAGKSPAFLTKCDG
jgi:hypothetical protein